MKKRLFCIMFALTLAFSAFGCGGGDITVSLDKSMPWGNSPYESCTYSVQRRYVGGDDDVTVASGEYTTTVREEGENYRLTNNLTLRYNDADQTETLNEYGYIVLNKGCTDSYTGEVLFNKTGLSPVSASKKYTLAQRKLCHDELGERIDNPAEGIESRYKISSDKLAYGDPRGYEYTVDYSSGKAHFKTTVGEITTATENDQTVYYRDYRVREQDIDIGNKTCFDNEQLNYAVRALSNITPEGSATFYLSNIYDSYVAGSYVRHTMSVKCSKETVAVAVDLGADYKFSKLEGELERDNNGKYVVPCVEVTVSLSASKPGPGIVMLITDPSITVTRLSGGEESSVKMTKLPLRVTYSEYSLSNVKLAFQTVYNLTSYSTRFAA